MYRSFTRGFERHQKLLPLFLSKELWEMRNKNRNINVIRLHVLYIAENIYGNNYLIQVAQNSSRRFV